MSQHHHQQQQIFQAAYQQLQNNYPQQPQPNNGPQGGKNASQNQYNQQQPQQQQQLQQQIDPNILNQGKMFIGGLSPITTEYTLKYYFQNYGEVLDPVVIMRDRETNASRGFGFIVFQNPDDLENVLSLTPHIVDGKQVDCKRAVPKDPNLLQQMSTNINKQQNTQQQQQNKHAHTGIAPSQMPPQFGQFTQNGGVGGVNQNLPNANQFQQMLLQQQQQQMYQQFMNMQLSAQQNQINTSNTQQTNNQRSQNQMQQQSHQFLGNFQFVQQQQQPSVSHDQQRQPPSQNPPQKQEENQPQQPNPPSQPVQQQAKESTVLIEIDDTPLGEGDEQNLGGAGASEEMGRQPQQDPQNTQGEDDGAGGDISSGSSQQNSKLVGQGQQPQQNLQQVQQPQTQIQTNNIPAQNSSLSAQFQPPQFLANLSHSMNPSQTFQRPMPQQQDRPIFHQVQNIGQHVDHNQNEGFITSAQGSQQKQTKPSFNSQFQSPQNINYDMLDPQYRKIFVGGLPHNLSDEEFRQYFIQYGEIEDCAILKDKRTGKPRGFGFVTYKSIACVEHVMSLKDTHTIQSKWVDCKRAVPAGQIIKDPTNPANQSSEKKTPPQVPQSTTPGASMPSQQSYHPAMNLFGNNQTANANNLGNQRQPPMSFQQQLPSNQFDLQQQQFQLFQSLMGLQQQIQGSQNQNAHGHNNFHLPSHLQQNPYLGMQHQTLQNDQDTQNKQMTSTSQPFFRQPSQQPQQLILQSGPNGTYTIVNQPQMQNNMLNNPQAAFMLATGQLPMMSNQQTHNQFGFTQGNMSNIGSQTSSVQNFQSGFPYTQTFKQQVQMQQQQQQLQQLQAAAAAGGFILMPNPALQNQSAFMSQLQMMNNQNLTQGGANSTPIQSSDMQQQEQTENHIHSLNAFCNELTLDEQDKNLINQKNNSNEGKILNQNLPFNIINQQTQMREAFNMGQQASLQISLGQTNLRTYNSGMQSSNSDFQQTISNSNQTLKQDQISQSIPPQHLAFAQQMSGSKNERPFISLSSGDQQSNNSKNKQGSNGGFVKQEDLKFQRDAMISNFNEEIKQKENENFDYESHDSNYQRRENVWSNPSQDGSQKNNQISGFYTHYHAKENESFKSHQNAIAAAQSEGQKSVSQQNMNDKGAFKFINEDEEDLRPAMGGSHNLSKFNPLNNQGGFTFLKDDEGDKFKPISLGGAIREEESPKNFKFSDSDLLQSSLGGASVGVASRISLKEPQEENLHNNQQYSFSKGPAQDLNRGSYGYAEPQRAPILKRVESADNIGEEVEQEMNQVRGRHILGSGKDFQFGKDRPESRSSNGSSHGSNHSRSGSGQYGPANTAFGSNKAGFGQIRSETSGQSGPSKRSDRQYKPY